MKKPNNIGTLNFMCGFGITYMLILYALAQSHKYPKFFLLVYCILSIISFIRYYDDKKRAINGEYRISEVDLLLMDLFGGWIGATFAHRFLNHKSTKTSFRLYFYAIILGHFLGSLLIYRVYIRL